MNARTAWSIALLFLMALRSQPGGAQSSRPDGYVLRLLEGVPGRLYGTRDAMTVPVLEIKTTKVSGCLLPLLVKSQVAGTHVRLSIDGIAPVSVCPAAMGPASAPAELEIGVGTFEFDVAQGRQVDHYTMRVSDSLIGITPLVGGFSSFSSSEFHRAPRNSLALNCMLPWGDKGPLISQEVVCRDFGRILIDSLKAREFSFGSGPDWPFQSAGEQQPAVRYFRYEAPEDFGRAYDLLQHYSRGTMSRIAANAIITLQNWRRVEISSYRCRPDQSQWCTDSLLRPRW